jgi:hypothetical protein
MRPATLFVCALTAAILPSAALASIRPSPAPLSPASHFGPVGGFFQHSGYHPGGGWGHGWGHDPGHHGGGGPGWGWHGHPGGPPGDGWGPPGHSCSP